MRCEDSHLFNCLLDVQRLANVCQETTRIRSIVDRTMSCVPTEKMAECYPDVDVSRIPDKNKGFEDVMGRRHVPVVYLARPPHAKKWHYDIDDAASNSLVESVDLGESNKAKRAKQVQ